MDLFSNDIGIVSLHPGKGTHWVANINAIFYDSHCFAPPEKLSKIIKKRNGLCFFSENIKEGLTSKISSCCAAYCLYIIY